MVAQPGMGSISGSVPVYAAQQQGKFSNSDYAALAFLRFSKQSIADVADGSIQLNKDGKNYLLTDSNNQFTISVGKKKVAIETTDQNNNVTKHNYSKSKVKKQFKGHEGELKAKNATDQAQAPSTDSNAAQQQNTTGQQSADPQANNGGQQMIFENEWFQRLIAAGWDEHADTADYYTQKAGLSDVQVAPQ